MFRSSFSNASGKTYECNERLSCDKFIRSGVGEGRVRFAEDGAFLRASPRVLVYVYIRIRGNSYTPANQSNRNNCHALAT